MLGRQAARCTSSPALGEEENYHRVFVDATASSRTVSFSLGYLTISHRYFEMIHRSQIAVVCARTASQASDPVSPSEGKPNEAESVEETGQPKQVLKPADASLEKLRYS